MNQETWTTKKNIAVHFNNERLASFQQSLKDNGIDPNRVMEAFSKYGESLPCTRCQENEEILKESFRNLKFSQKMLNNSISAFDLILEHGSHP